MLSGESGQATLKETLLRICKAKGLSHSDITKLRLSEWLPRFDSIHNLASLELAFQETAAEMLFVDPLYFCMSGENAGNLFSLGTALKPIKELRLKHGVSLVLIHHTCKREE